MFNILNFAKMDLQQKSGQRVKPHLIIDLIQILQVASIPNKKSSFSIIPTFDKIKHLIFSIRKGIAEKSNGLYELDLDGQIIAIKYFKDADYVDMFIGGNASEVSHLGVLPGGKKLKKFRHINQMLWRDYQNFYPESVIYK